MTNNPKDEPDVVLRADSTSTSTPTIAEREQEYDYFRDSKLRFLGYTNEIGEAFRHNLPKLVKPSYAVAISYVLADVAHKTHGHVVSPSTASPVRSKAHVAIDTFTWQILASVAFPGALVALNVRAAETVLPKLAPTNVRLVKWGPTAWGLAIIPLIVEPLDHLTHVVLDSCPYLRPSST